MKYILGIMPDSPELNKKAFHRLAKVLWIISLTPLVINQMFVLFEKYFYFNFVDFLAGIIFFYLFIPITYRAVLYVFTGNKYFKK